MFRKEVLFWEAYRIISPWLHSVTHLASRHLARRTASQLWLRVWRQWTPGNKKHPDRFEKTQGPRDVSLAFFHQTPEPQHHQYDHESLKSLICRTTASHLLHKITNHIVLHYTSASFACAILPIRGFKSSDSTIPYKPNLWNTLSHTYKQIQKIRVATTGGWLDFNCVGLWHWKRESHLQTLVEQTYGLNYLPCTQTTGNYHIAK